MKCPLNHQYLDSIFDAWWEESSKSLDTLMERVATAAYRKALEDCAKKANDFRMEAEIVGHKEHGFAAHAIALRIRALTPETEQQ